MIMVSDDYFVFFKCLNHELGKVYAGHREYKSEQRFHDSVNGNVMMLIIY